MCLLVELIELCTGLAQGLAQLAELCRIEVGFTQASTQPASALSHAVDLTQELGRGRQGCRRLAVFPGAQVQPWVFLQALANFSRAAQPGRAKLSHLAAGEFGAGHHRGQTQTVLAAAPRDGHQVAHRRMRRDGALADLLLDRRGQLADQAETAGDPAHRLVETSRQLFLAHPLLSQCRQKPALLELREGFGAALATVQQQCVALRQVPERGLHRVRT